MASTFIKKNHFGIILFLVSLFTLIIFLILAPFKYNPSYSNDINSNYYSYYGRNFFRYNFSLHHLKNMDAVEKLAKPLYVGEQITFYNDHPLFISLFSGVLQLFSPWPNTNARFASIISSLLILIFTVLIAEDVYKNKLSGLIAGFIVLLLPIFWQHGLVVNFEPLTLAFILITYYLYLKKRYNLFYLFLFLGGLIDWPFYLFVFSLFIIELLEKKPLKSLIAAIFIPFFSLIFFQFYTNGAFTSLIKAQTSILNQSSYISLLSYEFWARQYGFFTKNFGLGIIILLAFLLYMKVRNKFFDKKVTSALIIFGLMPTLNILIFRQWAHDHNFWNYYYIVFISLFLAIITKLKFKKSFLFLIIFLSTYQAIFTVTRIKGLYRQTLVANADSVRITQIFNEISKAAGSGEGFIYSHERIYDGMGRFARNYLDIQVKILSENEIKYPYICRFFCYSDIGLENLLEIGKKPFKYKISE